jgi:hypothetical protein
MDRNKLKFGTPDSSLSMTVTDIKPVKRALEFTINPPSTFSHAMTLYAPLAHVSFEPLSDNTRLGDMRITNGNGSIMFLIKGER